MIKERGEKFLKVLKDMLGILAKEKKSDYDHLYTAGVDI
jgi:hypothetical protein